MYRRFCLVNFTLESGRSSILILLSALLFSGEAVAQDSLAVDNNADKPSQFVLGVRQHYGFIIIHSRELRAFEDAYPRGTELTLNWHLMERKSWEVCNCYPRVGLLFSFFDFDNRDILGYGFNVAGFVEPFFTSHKKLKISLRPVAGLSLNTKPYDALTNPDNFSYSLPVNVYVQLSLALNYQMSKRLALTFAGNYNHVSNGGIKEPNKGVNFPTATLGLDYAFNPRAFEERLKKKYEGSRKRRYDIAISSFVKRIFANSAYFGVFGIMGSASQQIGRMSALTLGAEWIWDGSLKWRMENQLNIDKSYQRGAVLFGHEFLMGKFTFSQKIGVYFYDYTKYNDPVYQRYGINYHLSDQIYTGVHLKAHRHVADLIEIRLGWSFKGKG